MNSKDLIYTVLEIKNDLTILTEFIKPSNRTVQNKAFDIEKKLEKMVDIILNDNNDTQNRIQL